MTQIVTLTLRVNKKLRWMLLIAVLLSLNIFLLRGMSVKVMDPPPEWIGRINGGNMLYTSKEPSNIQLMASGNYFRNYFAINFVQQLEMGIFRQQYPQILFILLVSTTVTTLRLLRTELGNFYPLYFFLIHQTPCNNQHHN